MYVTAQWVCDLSHATKGHVPAADGAHADTTEFIVCISCSRDKETPVSSFFKKKH